MRPTLKALLILAGIFALGELGLLLHTVRRDLSAALTESRATMAEARGTIADLHVYAQEQLVRLRDPRNSKAIDAAIQTAAVFNGTGRMINTQVIPRAMKTLDGLAETITSLNGTIRDTNKTINTKIAPGAVQALQSSDEALKQLTKALQDASGRANVSLDDIHALFSDPSLRADQAEALAILRDVHGVTSDIDKATDNLPEITAELAKIAKTSNKFSKPLLIARIVSLLSWLVPWLQ